MVSQADFIAGITAGTFNTAIGYGALEGFGNLSNATAIGAFASVEAERKTKQGG
jgi:hypothetical protein